MVTTRQSTRRVLRQNSDPPQQHIFDIRESKECFKKRADCGGPRTSMFNCRRKEEVCLVHYALHYSMLRDRLLRVKTTRERRAIQRMLALWRKKACCRLVFQKDRIIILRDALILSKDLLY